MYSQFVLNFIIEIDYEISVLYVFCIQLILY